MAHNLPVKLLAGAGVVFVLIAAALTSMPTRAIAAVNCGSFATQSLAQAYLRAHPSDLDGLDTNNDGTACESNPCPCDKMPGPRRATPVSEVLSVRQTSASTTSAVAPGSALQVLPVSQEVYDTVAAAAAAGRDPGEAYRAATGATAGTTGARIVPPATGDAGLR